MKYLSLKISTLLLILFIFVSQESISQTDNFNNITETLNVSGNNAKTNNGSISYSVGEVFYSYIGQNTYNLSQGIQHAKESIKIEEDINNPEDTDILREQPLGEISMYPNPTTNFVTLAIKGVSFENEQRTYYLYDFQGKLLNHNKITQDNTEIDLSNLSTSIYLLQVFVDDLIWKTFKISKK